MDYDFRDDSLRSQTGLKEAVTSISDDDRFAIQNNTRTMLEKELSEAERAIEDFKSGKISREDLEKEINDVQKIDPLKVRDINESLRNEGDEQRLQLLSERDDSKVEREKEKQSKSLSNSSKANKARQDIANGKNKNLSI